MKYRLLGNSGLRVSQVCLGTMTFGEKWNWGASYGECQEIFNRFVDQGGNFIDTAVNYTGGESEEITGRLISGNRDNFVLATKFTLNTSPGNQNAWGNHRKNMKFSLEKSLRQLKTDYIDLYWVHIWDFTTRTEEVMRALDDLVRQGKVLHVGISDAPAWIVSQANTLSELRGWTPFSAIQVEYSLLERTTEFELLPMAKTFNLGVLAWSPLAFGVLTGKYQNRNSNNQGRIDNLPPFFYSRYFGEKADKVVGEVKRISEETGRSPSQVAINWLMQQSEQVIPIIGARNKEQMADNLKVCDFDLDREYIDSLNKLSKPDTIFPYYMWNKQQEEFFTGGTNLTNWKKPFDSIESVMEPEKELA